MKNPVDLDLLVQRTESLVQVVQQIPTEALAHRTYQELWLASLNVVLSLTIDARRLADSLERLAECVKQDFTSTGKFFDIGGIDKG